MSTLKKALERAKSERAGLTPAAVAPTETTVRGTEAPVYTTTRVVPVPPEKLLANRLAAASDHGPYADQFKLLRTRVLQQARLRGWKTIQVSGFGAGEGKSLLAANLAIAMARDTRQTTLLVDLDFRRPSQHQLFCLRDQGVGLDAYFAGDVPLEQVFVSPGIEKLTLLPTLRPVPRSAEIMGSPRMEEFIREIKGRYDDRFILFDTPAVGVCPDPLIVSEYVDCILLVARSGSTRKDAVSDCLSLVPREKLLGIVMNDLPLADIGRYGYA